MVQITNSAELRSVNAENSTLEFVKPSGLLGLSFKNFFLTILTLGIYSFWARVNVRRYIWSGIHIDGEPLQYTGTGGELFKGFLVVTLLIFIPISLVLTVVSVVFGPASAAYFITLAMVGPLMLFIIGLAIYRSVRYRLSRTVWRGVRGGLSGSAKTYAIKDILFWLLQIPTLGLITPKASVSLTSYIGNTAEFGDQKFSFNASSKPLYKRFALAWLFAIVPFAVLYGQLGLIAYQNGFDEEAISLALENDPSQLLSVLGLIPFAIFVGGIFFILYRVKLLRTLTEGFSYQGVTAKAEGIKFWNFVWLLIGNMMIVSFSFGILAPYAVRRGAKYLCRHIQLQGKIDASAIAQNTRARDTSGEGLATSFDIDAF